MFAIISAGAFVLLLNGFGYATIIGAPPVILYVSSLFRSDMLFNDDFNGEYTTIYLLLSAIVVWLISFSLVTLTGEFAGIFMLIYLVMLLISLFSNFFFTVLCMIICTIVGEIFFSHLWS